MTAHNRRKTPGAKEAKRPAAHAEAARQRREPTPEMLAQYGREIDPATDAVTAAYPHRRDTPKAWEEWKTAVHREYAVLTKYQMMWSHGELVSEEEARYGWDFRRDIELLQGGDYAQVDVAVAFLETNPYFFRSGYTKDKLIRFLKPPMLTPKYARRLGQAILTVVDARDDRDFRAFCRLARKVDAPALREQLTARLTSGDAGIRRRARWVLEALAQKDSEQNSQKEKQK